ncbi:MAG: M28 family peptidase [Bacteroidota bacterium]
MKKFTFLLLCLPLFSWAQQDTNFPELSVKESEVEFQLRFLAADEMKGRLTGTSENDIAARFIAETLRMYGFQPAPGQSDFLQFIDFVTVSRPSKVTFTINDRKYNQRREVLIMSGNVDIQNADAVFVGHGWVDKAADRDDYAGKDVEGKVVFAIPGIEEGQSRQEAFAAGPQKLAMAKEKGALALIELYALEIPWNSFVRQFGRSGITLAENNTNAQGMAYGWIKVEPNDATFKEMREGMDKKVVLQTEGYTFEPNPSNNVVGVLEGADPQLKDEYIILSAHFDHIGTRGDGSNGKDYIYNGARDNAMGTVAVLTAARSFAEMKPKRSVIVFACTGEERGLLGSRYYAENPLIPLDKTVFNINTDGAGYNTTEAVSVLGFGRTGTDEAIEKGTGLVGLGIIKDPAKEQNLFDRSDNVSFARAGIPALTFSPGFSAFDATIAKYYHQLADEADSVDIKYLLKYAQAFTHTARLIADMEKRPFWIQGDKYEEAGKILYKR